MSTPKRVQAFRFALDPTPAQARDLAAHCGAARFAYNHLLAHITAVMGQREAERSYGIPEDLLTPAVGWSAYSLRKHFNTVKSDVAPWWGEVSKEAFATGAANLAAALKNWSSSRSGKRAGRKVGFPGFKSKNRTTPSCTFTTGTIRVEPSRHHITLPRLGTIHTHESTSRLGRLVERGHARITQATISYRAGRWQVSLLAHVTPPPARPHRGGVVGVDVGVKDMLIAATADGVEVMRVPVPDSLRTLEVSRRALQRQTRNRQGPHPGVAPSRRWLAAQKRIRRLDHRAAAIREDTLHKATTALASRYGTVVVEDLSVVGMMTRGGAYKTGLNRGIARSAMSTTRRLLDYKTDWAGGRLVVADRFYPSSKTCSDCGAVKAKLLLSERTFVCPECGVVADRDVNAATNLALLGERVLAGRGPVAGRGAKQKTSVPSGAGAAGYEASTLLCV